jgi:protein-tyrosine phosphatase-like protein
MVPTLSLADQVDKVAQRLSDEFAGTVPDPEVRRLVVEVYDEMASARVTQFVPVLVDRSVRARLRARAS